MAKLWKAFRDRVDPIVKLSFPWTLERLGRSITDPGHEHELTSGEKTLVIASCYFGLISLTKEECLAEFGKPKADMRATLRRHSENAFRNINMMAIDDLASLKALCLYVVCNSFFFLLK